MRKHILLATVVATIVGSFGMRVSGASEDQLPPTVTYQGNTLTQTGKGVRTAIFGIKAYYIAHYAPKNAFVKNTTAESIAVKSDVSKAVIQQFLRSVGKMKLKNGYQKGIESNNPKHALNTHKDSIAEFLKIVEVSVEENTTIALLHVPQKGVRITITQPTTPPEVTEKWIMHPGLAELLWRMWFGPNPPSPGVTLTQNLMQNL